MKTHDQRLFFLDWVRIIAFFLLILYHVGMYYVSWDWHVKSPFASDAIEPLMILSSPWRLGLLFLVSGVACSLMLDRIGTSPFVRQRSLRLLLPLLFGMFVIVPPQAYFEVVEKVAYKGSYLDFMRLYVSSYQGFCRDGDCLDLPTWNHLWFVAYLWVYCMLLALIRALVPGRRIAPQEAAAACTPVPRASAIASCLTGWKLIVLPALVLAALRLLLVERFPTTHGLTDDWYNHAQSISLFLFGALLARIRPIWQQFDGLRWHALVIALFCWAALIIWFSLPEAIAIQPDLHSVRLLMRAAYALCAWTAIVAACGFAHRHLDFDGPARRYLTQAVFPVYIVHQTLIVSLAHLIKPAGIAPATEGLLLIVLTLCLSFGIFEVVRRIAMLRPFFGLASRDPLPATHAKKPATANC